MTREAFRQEHQERRTFSAAAASTPSGAIFRRWAFAADPDACAVALEAFGRSSAPAPSWLLQPLPEADERPATRRQHAPAAVFEDQQLAARIAWLDFLGAEVHDRERCTWEEEFTADPAEDAADAAIWAGLIHGDPWSVHAQCEARWMPLVERVFAGVLAGRELPPDVQRRALADLRDAFFFRLLGPEDPGWRALGVRVLETGGPLRGPGAALSSDRHGDAGHCVALRGGWSDTVARLLPERTSRSVRGVVASRWFDDPERLEQLIDLHVVLRLLHRAPTDSAAAWRIVTQNRGKARGRLRALVAQSNDWDPLFQMSALADRTSVALARWGWAWAWSELAHDFSFDGARALTPPCAPVPKGLDPLDDEGADLVAVWVLLVVLKGRLSHLRRWVVEGGTGDRDSTWARLQGDLPSAVRDPDGGYQRLRLHLGDNLNGVIEDWRNVLERLVSLTPGRRLKRDVLALLGEVWHSGIPLPKSGFPTFIEHIRSALCTLEDRP